MMRALFILSLFFFFLSSVCFFFSFLFIFFFLFFACLLFFFLLFFLFYVCALNVCCSVFFFFFLLFFFFFLVFFFFFFFSVFFFFFFFFFFLCVLFYSVSLFGRFTFLVVTLMRGGLSYLIEEVFYAQALVFTCLGCCTSSSDVSLLSTLRLILLFFHWGAFYKVRFFKVRVVVTTLGFDFYPY